MGEKLLSPFEAGIYPASKGGFLNSPFRMNPSECLLEGKVFGDVDFASKFVML